MDEADIRTVLREAARQVRPAHGSPPSLPPPRRGSAAKLGVIGISLLVAFAGLVIAAVAFFPDGQDQPPDLAESPRPRGSAPADNLLYWTKGGREWDLVRARDGSVEASIAGGTVSSAISPDGGWLATVEGVAEGRGSVRLVSLASGDGQVVGGLPPVNSLTWAGVGEVWLCDGDGSIRAVSVPERQVRFIAKTVGCVEIALSPVGDRLAFSSSNGDMMIAPRSDPSSGTVVVDEGNNGWPSWSPDGTRLAFHQFSRSAASIKVLDVATGDVTTAVSGVGEHQLRPAWSPEGSTIAFVRVPRDGPAQVQLLDVATGTVQVVNPSTEEQDLPLWISSSASPAPQPSPAPSLPPTPPSWFIASTYRDGDKMVMPITFPDGTRMELLYPPSLDLAELGINPNAYGAMPGSGCGGNLLIRSFDAKGEVFEGEQPIAVFETPAGGRAELWPGKESWPGDWLVFQFGRWQVLVSCPVPRERAIEGAEQWASALEGEETADGFLILTARDPLTVAEKGDRYGPEFFIEGATGHTLLVLAPATHCVDSEPERVEGLVEWCIDGKSTALVVSAYAPADDMQFIESVIDGLEVRSVPSP